MAVSPWSQYEITFITEPPKSILFELIDRGFFLNIGLKGFKYDPFNDYRSIDMEKSYIGCLCKSDPRCEYYQIEYISEDYFKKVDNILSNLNLSVDEIVNIIKEQDNWRKINHNGNPSPPPGVIKRGLIINGSYIINPSLSISITDDSSYSFKVFKEKAKICRLNLVKILDPKLGWIPYSKPIEVNVSNNIASKIEELEDIMSVQSSILEGKIENLSFKFNDQFKLNRFLKIEIQNLKDHNKSLSDRIHELENPPFIVS